MYLQYTREVGETNMDIKNSVQIDKDETYNYYVIIDSEEKYANDCFLRNGLYVEYRNTYKKRETPYIIRECRIRRDDEKYFNSAMRELMVVMRVNGHEDYRQVCEVLSVHAEMLFVNHRGLQN